MSDKKNNDAETAKPELKKLKNGKTVCIGGKTFVGGKKSGVIPSAIIAANKLPDSLFL